MVRLPARIRPTNHDLQPFQPMVPPPVLDRPGRGSGYCGRGDEERVHRQHLCQGAPFCPWRQRGAKAQDIGPSRGGQTTKVHALTDVIGRPFAFTLTAGNISDIKAAPALLSRLNGARYLIGDKGYDADALRISLRDNRTMPVIPGRSHRKRKPYLDKRRYRERHLIENAFCRIKDFRRVATRYDKLAANFLSAVAIATLVAFWI